jgi:hypothetical protein
MNVTRLLELLRIRVSSKGIYPIWNNDKITWQNVLILFANDINEGNLLMELIYMSLNNEKINSFLYYGEDYHNYTQIKIFEEDGFDLEKMDVLVKNHKSLSYDDIKNCIFNEKKV